MESALVHGRFAEKANRYLIRFPVLARERQPGCQRNLAANNCVTAHKIYARVEQMHRSALAPRTTAGLAVKFGHHRIG